MNHLTPRKQKRGRRRGSIFGDALEHARLTFNDGTGTPESALLDDFFHQFLTQEYERILDEEMLSGEEMEELELERIKLGVVLLCYVERYGIDQRREIQFEIPLSNPRTGCSSRSFILGGKIDGIVVTGEKTAVVIEDKLVGQIQQVMIERLPLDDQVSEYVDAFIHKGWEASVWYRHTRWPGINPKGPKEFKTKDNYPGETLQEFKQRLYEDMHERDVFYFDQQVLSFPILHLDDYRRGRWGTAQEILRSRNSVLPLAKTIVRMDKKKGVDTTLDEATALASQEVYPKHPTRCWEYGGCEFIPLCSKYDGAEALYVEQEDNPELNTGGVTSDYGPTDGA